MQLVQHTLYGDSLSGADTALAFQMDGQLTGTVNIVNPGFPRAVRASGIWINSATLGVTVAGNWNVRLRLNRTGADAATFTFNPTAANEVFSGFWSTQALIQPTDQYHLLADGPTRVLMLIRAVLEFEVI